MRSTIARVLPAVLALAVPGCKLVGYEPKVTAIAVAPGSPSIALITTQQFTATGTYSDDSQRDVSGEVTWSSSNGAVATVSATGLATPVGSGTAVITASLNGVSGGTTLTVTNAQLQTIEVTPANPSIANGTTIQLGAVGHFDDTSQQDLTSQVSWTSDATSVTVGDGDANGPKGLASSIVLGATSATVTATLDLVSGSTVVTVKAVTLVALAVTPGTFTLTVGRYRQYVATGTFSDASTQVMTREVTWTSSDTGIATIDQTGLAHGVQASASPVSITATSSALLGSVSGSASLTVQSAGGGY